ncbi:bacteriohemerythrin [Fundidesulfovibrio terrae]|uniref:bacteriohemerythrin n=1 Tax=Fundidesulfovibrio terrae TaxID=2922866 RepID=UPI001FAF2688|nr:hemerythrin family protein [Fundidesulfovibrio terrae]
MNTDTPGWSPNLAMGHPEIDEQHRMLIHMIRELSARMDAGEHRQGVLDALQGLLAYAATHFEDEEEMMEEAEWEGLDRHEGLHAEFLWKAGDLEAQLKDDYAQASRELLEYLLTWLVAHIATEDRAFFSRARP